MPNDYVFFSKTKWSEEPRLRHQLAKLVSLDASSRIIFFEKPCSIANLLSRKNNYHKNNKANEEGNIFITKYLSLFHHKISFGPLRIINEWIKIRGIKKQIIKHNIKPDCIVFNFNYEYSFLKKIFKKNKIISVINDLHWGTANRFLKLYMESAYIKTAKKSDVILTVSEPLKNELLRLSVNEINILYPWGEEEFNTLTQKKPNEGSRNLTLLYWGFVSERVDFEYLSELYFEARNLNWTLNYFFIGPDVFKSNKYKNFIMSYEHFTFLSPMTLDSAIQASGANISIIPYRIGNPEDLVTTFPNKLPRLVRACLPVFVSGMPDIIKTEFIFKLTGSPLVDVENLLKANDDGHKLLKHFECFYRNNSSPSRLKFINEIINS